jgi:hypothetical protein
MTMTIAIVIGITDDYAKSELTVRFQEFAVLSDIDLRRGPKPL